MLSLELPTYKISIGPISGSHLDELRQRQYAGLVVLVDDNTAVHCWPLVEPLLVDFNPHLIQIPAGELHKTLETCQYIWKQLFAVGAGRNWCMLNLGGGVIGDMGGFCAGTFKRGIDFIQIPTTLLSQVDASVGGKLGIDFNQIKNSIGLFQDPVAVWADPGFFPTLPARELRSGFAEIIKHALIADQEQWSDLLAIKDLSEMDWPQWVARSVTVKQQIVKADPYEKGLRKALNFGHTIGHAIESFFLHRPAPLLHGEAIAAGMICEAYLSNRQVGLSKLDLSTIVHFLIDQYGYQPLPEQYFDQLIEYMKQDKKNEDARINLSLIPAPGQVMVNQTATPEAIIDSMRYYNQLG